METGNEGFHNGHPYLESGLISSSSCLANVAFPSRLPKLKGLFRTPWHCVDRLGSQLLGHRFHEWFEHISDSGDSNSAASRHHDLEPSLWFVIPCIPPLHRKVDRVGFEPQS